MLYVLADEWQTQRALAMVLTGEPNPVAGLWAEEEAAPQRPTKDREARRREVERFVAAAGGELA